MCYRQDRVGLKFVQFDPEENKMNEQSSANFLLLKILLLRLTEFPCIFFYLKNLFFCPVFLIEKKKKRYVIAHEDSYSICVEELYFA
jgi:hypothetical protein